MPDRSMTTDAAASPERMGTGKAIGRLVRYRPWLYAGKLLSRNLVFTVAPLATGLILKRYFDELSGAQPAALGVWALAALLLSVGIARALAILLDITAVTTWKFVLGALLRRNALEHILGRPAARALPESSGEAVNRFRDDPAAIGGFTEDLLAFSVTALFVPLALLTMAWIDPAITALVVLPLLLVVALTRLAARRIQRYREASRSAAGQVSSFIGEVFGAVLAVKVGGARGRVLARFAALNEDRRRTGLRDSLFEAGLQSVTWSMGSVATGITLLVATDAMRREAFTVGDFALFVSYLQALALYTSVGVGQMLTAYRQAGVSLGRMRRLMQGAPPDRLVRHAPVYLRGDAPEAPQPDRGAGHRLEALQARGLTYRYPETGRGIAGVDLRIRRGEFVVVTGRIGSGKSTLLRVLLGLLPRDAGEISWNGIAVDDPASYFVPPRSAYVPQSPTLFSDPLRENLLLGYPEERADLSAALRAAVLEEDVRGLDGGLNTLIGPRGVKLSGGQLQRAAAARALVRDSELLVVDDLSSALDVETERLLWARSTDRPGVTVLAASHRRAALQHAHRIVVLRDGRLEAEGRLRDLLRTSEEMRLLWARQETDTAPGTAT